MKFYERPLGFEREVFQESDGQPRYALRFGEQTKRDSAELIVLSVFSYVETWVVREY